MILDAHVHLMPKRVRDDRSRFCQSDPAFGSIYCSEKAKLATEDEIIAYMDNCGIEQAIVFGFPWESHDLVATNNDEVWSFHQRHPGRIVPFAVLSSTGLESDYAEAKRTLEGGFSGLGELAIYHRGWSRKDIEALDPVLKLAAENKVPVVLHVNEPVGHHYCGKIPVDFSALVSVISNNPDVDIVLAHFGGGVFIYSLMPEIETVLRRTYVDTAASPFLYDSRVFDIACRVIGPEKILFGSDFPLLSMTRYVSQLDQSGISETSRNAILGDNAAKLLQKRSATGRGPARTI
jgi:uncharacterized protein